MSRPTTRRSSSRLSAARSEGHPGNAEAMVQHFNSLEMPEAEVNFDVGLFMQKYFINAANGRPDRTKSSEAVCLAGSGLLPQQETKLREAASRVKGLALKEDTEGRSRALFLGWSDDVVGARIVLWKCQKRQEAERQVEAREAEHLHHPPVGEAKNSKHEAYIQKRAAEDPPRESGSAAGSYAIRCPSIEDQWDDDDGEDEDMTLDIKKPGRDGVYEAGFRFRVLEGVMLLSTDKKLLVKHRNEVDGIRSRENAWDWNYLRGGNPEEEEGGSGAGSKKRKRNVAAVDGAPNPRRFWLMWNGRETGESHLQADYDMNHTGCIEFTDDTFTAFRAEMNLEFVGGDDLFQGFKVADAPSRKRNTTWKKFHAATYKYITI